MPHWPLAFLEFFVVLVFGIGWLILEWQCKKLDKPVEPNPPQASAVVDSEAKSIS
jgi:hypothetical protein